MSFAFKTDMAIRPVNHLPSDFDLNELDLDTDILAERALVRPIEADHVPDDDIIDVAYEEDVDAVPIEPSKDLVAKDSCESAGMANYKRYLEITHYDKALAFNNMPSLERYRVQENPADMISYYRKVLLA